MGCFVSSRRIVERRKYKQPSFSPLLFIISAEGGGDEQCSEAEKIAGSAMNRLGASEEPEGRVSGMIRANSVKICVRRSRTQHAAKPRYSFTPLECLLPTLFSQSTERAGTHAGVWKQEFPPRRKGGVGGIPPTFARTRATDYSHTSHGCPAA